MKPYIEINGRRVGAGYPAYVIAEMSANHNRDFDRAVKIVEAARRAGADAVKTQTYTADMNTIDCRSELFRVKGTIWKDQYLYELYQQASTPWEWQPKLKKIAGDLGLDFFCTVKLQTVELLEGIGIPAYKIASSDIVDLQLLRTVATLGKPVIISTGMATLSEIEEAAGVIAENGGPDVVFLKCTAAYPAPYDEMNLRTMTNMAQTFQVPTGLSDHSLGDAIPVAAVAMGASMIEKHLTLSRAVPSPDSSFSLEPEEFREMVEKIRNVEAALGTVRYGATENEAAMRTLRRSLFVVRDMKQGEPFTDENVRCIRPGHGLKPRYLDDVMGKCASTDIARGTPLRWELISRR